jgi:NitT/TauT family transport system substrate-binding protein
MLAGALDIAYVGTAPPITAISQGLDAKIVAAVNINGSDLVLRPNVTYSGPKSLEGLSIGTFPPGSIQDIVMKKWLGDNGVDISKVQIHGMGPGDAVTAIEAGKIDGVFLPHPSPAQISQDGKGRSVVQSGEMWPNHACCSLLISGKLLREQPALVEQIIKTHIKATEYVNAHPDESAEIYAKKTGQNLAMVKESIKSWDGKWVSDPTIQISSTVEYAKIDQQLGYINKTLSKDDLFDTDIYAKALA